MIEAYIWFLSVGNHQHDWLILSIITANFIHITTLIEWNHATELYDSDAEISIWTELETYAASSSSTQTKGMAIVKLCKVVSLIFVMLSESDRGKYTHSQGQLTSLKWKYYVNKIFINDCTGSGSCLNDNFCCSQWWEIFSTWQISVLTLFNFCNTSRRQKV